MAGVVSAQSNRPSWLGRHLAVLLLDVTGAGLVVGGALHLAGAATAGDALWVACGAIGAAYSLWTMVDSLRRGRVGVDLIALLASVGALAVGEYLAAAVISVMMASGRALEGWAAGRANRDLRRLLERAPTTAHRYEGEELRTVDADSVAPGDRLMVQSGELVPTDGLLLTSAVLDESALTGEALPVSREPGEPARSGVLNAGSPFDLRATARASESAYAGIVRLVAEAESSQAPFVRLADRYAIWFLVLSLVVAAGAWIAAGPARAVAVLVVATPCPLILAAPVALVGGLSHAARRGVVVKGGAVLERLARCTTLLIDKTGTLTTGHPSLTTIVPSGTLAPDDVLRLAASLDQVSPHVLAHSVVRAAREHRCDLELPERVEEVAGAGIRGVVGGHHVVLGKASWVGVEGSPGWAKTARRRARLDGSLTVFVGVDEQPAGVLVLDDPVRRNAPRTIRSLRRSGIGRIVMVTGDRPEVADAIGAVIGVDEVLAERSPADKLDVVNAERLRAPTMMVGTASTMPRPWHWPTSVWRWLRRARRLRPKQPTSCSRPTVWTDWVRPARWPFGAGGLPSRASLPAWRCRSWPWGSRRSACFPQSGERCFRRESTSSSSSMLCVPCVPSGVRWASTRVNRRSPGGSNRST